MSAYRKRRNSMFLFGRRAITLTAAVLCALAIVTSQGLIEPAQAVQPDVRTARMYEPEDEYVPGEVLVLLSADVDRNGVVAAAEDLSGVEAAVDGQIERRVVFSRGKEVLRVKLPDGKSVETAIAENWGARDRRILVVEPNYRVRIARTPNDPRFPYLWGMHNTGQTGGTEDADIDAPEAWDIATGVPETSDVIVGIIDTGIDYLHPDLVANMWVNPGEIPDNRIDDDGNGYIDDVYGYDFFGDDGDPSDAYGHGTHCAGTIAGVGDNGLGVAGVNWQCKLMALRAFNASGGGNMGDSIEAIIYGVNNGVKILSNSWGGFSYSESMEFAIVYARNHGVLFVAAAGNYGWDTDSEPFYPASYEVSNVISVAATDDEDKLASFSNYGDESVDVGAPGVSILSTYPTYRTVFFEDFQGAARPTFTGTQMTKEGVGNYWGTVLSPTYYDPNNIAARGDWNHSRPYSSGSYGSIVTSPIDTRGLRGLSMFFEFRLESDYDDVLAVYVWDGVGWREVFSISGPYYYYEGYFYGMRIDIPDSYRNSGMKVRFRWLTDGVDNYYFGAEVDNIRIQCIDDHAENYAWNSGTSMAAPHVAGVAALVMANAPVPAEATISLQELKTRLVWTGDPVPALDGKTVSGCRLNAYNALTATPGLKVVTPNGGESWELSSKYNIRWYSIGGGPVVDIYLLKGGDVYRQLANDVPSDNKFAWKPPPSLPADSDYRIRITDGTYSDESDEDFELYCKPIKKPSHPDPCDGKTNVPLDTGLEWNFGGLEPVTITFDEVPLGMMVDGMEIEDVKFRFFMDEEPSEEAFVTGGGSFVSEYIQIPCIDGDAEGILVLDFTIPVYGVSYGFLFSAYGYQQNASTMVLIDSSYREIGTFSADANDMGFYYMEGTNSGTSTKPIAHAVISFSHPDPEWQEFLLDNLMYNPIPGGGLLEAATQDENRDTVEGEGAEQQDVNDTDGVFHFLLGAEGPNLAWPEYLLSDALEYGVKESEAPEVMAMTEDVGVLHSGGPDAGGYMFIDSDEPNGPSFDWIEIASGAPPGPPGAGPGGPAPPPGEIDVVLPESATGTNLFLGDDDWYYPVPLPFKFSYYGRKYNRVAISSNGTIYFVDRNMYYWNCCIPCDAGVGVDRFIAVYWDDLYPNRYGNDNVYFAVTGEAPNRILVVQWEGVRNYGGSQDNRITCQAQLFEGSGDILLLYVDPSMEAGSGATVGIQRNFGSGLNYLCNERGLHPGLAVLFKHEPPCPTTWDVYFGTEPNALELIGSDLTEPRYDPTPEPGETLNRGIRYYWQVVAKNCCSAVDSNDWSFSTENTPPVADAGDEQTVECVCNTQQGTQVTLDGTRSSDDEDTPLTYTWTGPFLESPVQGAVPTVTLDSGCPDEYVITLIVNDGIEDSEPNDVLITVVDTVPPEFEFSVAPTFLWPPSHKMVEITPSWTVSDECDAAPDVSVVGIVMSEDANTVGDGHTTDDFEIGDDGSIYVRSERSGTNSGRIYTITSQAVDDSGNATLRSATVGIPHDMRVLAGIADRWLSVGSPGSIQVDLNGDGTVNLVDFAIFAENWIR